jgi:integrase/recombinase XerD
LKRTKLSAHSLRHTAGQILIQQGIPPIHVQRQLRHEQFETTQFYIKKQTERDYMEQMPD